MFFANLNGNRIKATLKIRGLELTCPTCSAFLIVKCGAIKAWHFAHISDSCRNSWYQPMTPWHSAWQSNFPDECQEVIIINEEGIKHIADVKINGLVIEFQHYRLSNTQISEREKFYVNMIWVVEELTVMSEYFDKPYYNDNDETLRLNRDKGGVFTLKVSKNSLIDNPNKCILEFYKYIEIIKQQEEFEYRRKMEAIKQDEIKRLEIEKQKKEQEERQARYREAQERKQIEFDWLSSPQHDEEYDWNRFLNEDEHNLSYTRYYSSIDGFQRIIHQIALAERKLAQSIELEERKRELEELNIFLSLSKIEQRKNNIEYFRQQQINTGVPSCLPENYYTYKTPGYEKVFFTKELEDKYNMLPAGYLLPMNPENPPK